MSTLDFNQRNSFTDLKKKDGTSLNYFHLFEFGTVKIGAIQVYMNRRMGLTILLYSYNGILLNIKKV